MSKEVNWSRGARDDLKRIDHRTQARIIASIDRFADDDYGDVQRLHGASDEWRLRVGQYRVRFTYEDLPARRVIKVLRVLPRDRAYRDSDD